MIIIGAGNLGLHVLDILLYENYQDEIVFFDETKKSTVAPFDKFRIIQSIEEVREYLQKKSNTFISAIGNNRIRGKLTDRFEKIGGKLVSAISRRACLSTLNEIKNEVVIQPFVSVAHNVTFGKSCVIHANSVIGHDIILGNYVSVATLTTLIGPCEIGDYTFIGTNCTIMPGIKIGKNVIVGAGSIVNRNLKDYENFIPSH